MCDNDEQLIPQTLNRSKSLYDGSGDIDDDLRNLVQRKPKPHSQYVSYIHGEKDRTMLSPTLRRRISLSNRKWLLMIKSWYYQQTMQNPNINDTNIERAQGFFVFLRNNRQSKPTAIPTWCNKCTSNSKPKWSPQTKTPSSKPKGGTVWQA